MLDRRRAREREHKRERRRIQQAGFGHSVRGRALHVRFLRALVNAVEEDRKEPIDKKVATLLATRDASDLADHLLAAGLSVAHEQQIYGIAATWLGKCLGDRDAISALRVGSWGINMLCNLSAFGVEKKDRGKGKIGSDNIFVLRWSSELNDLVCQAFRRHIDANYLLRPMLTPPEPWTQVDRGVVPLGHGAVISLVDRGQAICEAWRKTINQGHMGGALGAVNYLQEVPLSLDTTTLDLRIDPDCPARPLPPTGHEPPACNWNERKEYLEAVSQVIQWESDTTTARVMAAAGRFWLPKNCDFRGRVYDVPDFRYQGGDANRALIQFADPEPVGPDGLLWIYYNAANQADGVPFGVCPKPSRLSFAEKQLWVANNIGAIRATGTAALNGEWPRADLLPGKDGDVFQYIRACIEVVRADNDPNFLSHLPVSIDTSCSGLQQLSALMRDEIGGKYTNLIPGSNEDIYEAVAFIVHDSPLRDKHWRETGTYEICATLMDGECDRKIAKAPTMTWLYGATLFRMTQQVRKVLEGRGQSSAGAWALAQAILEAIKELAPRAVAATDFLRDLVEACTSQGRALQYTTIDGVPILNRYYKPDLKNYNFPLNGGRVRVKWTRGDTDEVRELKASGSIAANFVHALDASHLRLVAVAARAERLGLLCVHDAYAFLPSRIRRSGQMVREQFVLLHSHDHLARVLEETRNRLLPGTVLPVIPKRGTLDVSQVIHSEKAFA